jgi:N-methylhydantoinase A
MSLDVEAARKAVETIGVKLGCDVYQAAKGIIDIVNENMLGAIRVTSVEKGHDPRDYALIALGGAGPLHGNALGTLSGSWPVIVPTMPGVLSALGFLASNVRNEFSKTRITTVSAADAEELAKDLKQLGEAALDWLAREGVPESQREIDYEVDMRYLRQGFELPISATIGEVRNKLDLLAKRFGEAHLKLYTFDLDSEVEVVNLRAVGIGRVDRISFTKAKPGGRNVDDAIVDADHRAYFDGELVATPIYDRALMDVGHRIEGPAIITQFDSTTLVLPGYAAEIDGYSNIIIRPHGRT